MAAYDIQAIWEGQKWLPEGFKKLTIVIGRALTGTFITAKGEDIISAEDRRERLRRVTIIHLGSTMSSLSRILLCPKSVVSLPRVVVSSKAGFLVGLKFHHL